MLASAQRGFNCDVVVWDTARLAQRSRFQEHDIEVACDEGGGAWRRLWGDGWGCSCSARFWGGFYPFLGVQAIGQPLHPHFKACTHPHTSLPRTLQHAEAESEGVTADLR
jgi:hypothetical protein